MFGLNWIDIVIVVLLILAIVEGIRIGIVSQLLVITGFFGALFLAGWIFPHVLPIHDLTIRTEINASLVLITASYVAFRSYDAGQKLHWSFRLGKFQNHRIWKLFETILGGLPGLVAGLTLVWLLGVAIGRLPFAGFSNSVSDSRIVAQLSRSLPSVPAVFGQFDKQIDPNALPYVFTPPKPSHTFDYSVADVQAAAKLAEDSLVRITSFGCGGIVSGTGFVVGSGLVATNAHVIAGVKRPIIKYHGTSYEGVPIYFDATLDLAILKVQHLSVPILSLAPTNAALNNSVAILGYPRGNYRVTPGIIRDTLAVSARSIYDQGNAGRGIYVLQSTVDYGNSGGPIVLKSGQVAGILFSKSLDVPDQAYALTSPHIASALKQSEHSTRRVSTRACMVH